MGRKRAKIPSRACVQRRRTLRFEHQNEFIGAGPIARRAIGRDTVYLEFHHCVSWLALALGLCPLPVPGLADRVRLLEFLVEGPGMIDQCHLLPPTLALTQFLSPTSPSRHTPHRSEDC